MITSILLYFSKKGVTTNDVAEQRDSYCWHTIKPLMPEHGTMEHGTPWNSGRTTEHPGTPAEHPKIPTEHQWNTSRPPWNNGTIQKKEL